MCITCTVYDSLSRAPSPWQSIVFKQARSLMITPFPYMEKTFSCESIEVKKKKKYPHMSIREFHELFRIHINFILLIQQEEV